MILNEILQADDTPVLRLVRGAALELPIAFNIMGYEQDRVIIVKNPVGRDDRTILCFEERPRSLSELRKSPRAIDT